jgi:hypothetical protein
MSNAITNPRDPGYCETCGGECVANCPRIDRLYRAAQAVAKRARYVVFEWSARGVLPTRWYYPHADKARATAERDQLVRLGCTVGPLCHVAKLGPGRRRFLRDRQESA